MPTLTERIDVHIAALEAERGRIQRQAAENVAEVDRKIAGLTRAKATLTADVETSYAQLRTLGLIKEI